MPMTVHLTQNGSTSNSMPKAESICTKPALCFQASDPWGSALFIILYKSLKRVQLLPWKLKSREQIYSLELTLRLFEGSSNTIISGGSRHNFELLLLETGNTVLDAVMVGPSFNF